MVVGQLNNWPPRFQKPWPVVVDAQGMVSANKGVHPLQPKFRGKSNQALKMFDRAISFLAIGSQTIGVITESADRDP